MIINRSNSSYHHQPSITNTRIMTMMNDGNHEQQQPKQPNDNHHLLQTSNGNNGNNIDSSTNIIMDAAVVINDFIKYYEERMISYIYEQPHLPPTLFELKIKHRQTKQDLLNMFEKHLCSEMVTLMNNNNNIHFLLKHLDNLMETTFNSIMELSLKEYRLCQTGFIIGWKDNKQQQQQQQNASNSNNNNNNNQLINAKLADHYIINDRF
ncbi:uncharacterized protein LOC142645351 [Dermatophagoides pteronyssinus]|uniref:Uncharacterized protein n=1 Tax=Dermatophagoides pteronyssinus TaxID=6956 RepID=A0ABQ8IWB2_DERPT|nr:hypothetical protein DERP_008814 [Dermatophagoides pteronyssinus]